LEAWRAEARQGALSELIWDIYRETGFFDFVGGLPGGEQRQANLRALYDRARQFEATSQRGLFRFLRFIERMRDSGGDLGTARALGEREDVVRIMSIHKSKGLEFPVVIVAGLGKRFNETDVNGSFLLHRQLGFGPRYVDAELRVAYPTLPMMAIRRRLRMEMLAEEMRVLYVALTRPKEKLILIGTVKSAEKEAVKWGRQLDCESWALPDHDLAQARSYLDWLGPALIRHPQAGPLRETGGMPERTPAVTAHDSSRWRFAVVPAGSLLSETAAAVEVRFADERTEALAQLRPAPNVPAEGAERVARRLSWQNPYARAAALPSKTTVSELKRIAERNAAPDGDAAFVEVRAPFAATDPVTAIGRRPKFIEQRGLTAAERGTAMHAVMQHMPLTPDLDEETVRSTLERMVEKRLLTPEQRAAVDEKAVLAFFAHDIGRRLTRAERVFRELPFSLGMPAGDVYGEAAQSASGETVLVQGIIDCLFEENGGFVLLDYKTDAVRGDRLPALVERYRPQLELYARAVETVWKKPVHEKALYFFDGSHVVVW
jgi:ATP-dependent helicase/nuclease subunit A